MCQGYDTLFDLLAPGITAADADEVAVATGGGADDAGKNGYFPFAGFLKDLQSLHALVQFHPQGKPALGCGDPRALREVTGNGQGRVGDSVWPLKKSVPAAGWPLAKALFWIALSVVAAVLIGQL